MTDASGDTALHKAVRCQHLDVVKLLVTEDSEFEFPHNHAQEKPLYLASKSGFHGALINILISSKKPTYTTDCIRSLWRWNKPLCEELDLWGWNSQHVKLGLQDIVSDMLGWKISLVYLPAGSENDWTTAIHIAASEGMESTLYNAAMRGNIGDGNFLPADHLKRNEENGYQVTQKGNTVLHVASLYGNSHFMEEVIKITPALLCYQNKKNETALHIAANEGQTEVVHVLLARIEDHNTKEKLTRMTGASGDTALHKAVRSQHLDVVKIMVKEDPEFEFPPNHAQEIPLYLAAESGFHDALINILESYKKPIYAAGPSNRTMLQVHLIERRNCITSLWHWNNPLCEELDLWGWNSLHYVVKLGLKDVVSDMLGWKKSLVYLPAGSENDWTTAIHIAASEGDVNMINKLLNHCPNCWDMLNSNNQNALHVSILNNQDKVVRFFLDSDKCDSLVDEPDSDDNTPLHLVAVSALLCTVTTKKEKLVEDLCSIGRFGKHDFEVKRKYEYMHSPNDETGTGVKMQLREVDHDKAKKAYQKKVESIMKAAQIHIVVATLIMTDTFAAGITLPGSFESNSDSPNQGWRF
ncbi:hypothetical protein CQW23_08253 [Capsicum baccatum]|uniref:PGG domain-containing protein n=1 Tax=Capsicum baccatum TaxID=33114 RepID=A0A2G2X8X5_CAPBA|nr:hypothetical protein CQW23_08253 [Capsicum baccatum]